MKVSARMSATACAALGLALSLPAFAGGDFDRPEVTRNVRAPRTPEPTFKIESGIDGDVFPAFANYASLQAPDQRKWGVVSVRVSNSTDTEQRYRIAVRVTGWSDEEVQIVTVPAGGARSFLFAPTFLPRLYQNREITGATAQVRVTDVAGDPIYSTTVPVRMRAVEDIFWGRGFKYAQFIASWVTPHDARVEQVLSRAKELMPGRRLPGYEDWKDAAGQERETRLEARAIYTALQRQRLSYVKSSLTFGANTAVSERIRTPRESIAASSANCIDAAVLFASAFENLGMEPVIVLVPGHAYVGVKSAENSDKKLFIDVALTGRFPFEGAVRSAERGLARFSETQITQIAISDARRAGIYPIPQLP
ncbi:MAG: hypothetical protein DMG64_06700 [Acidobacteria bacterium]|nr:MAG: hypothetical protein DMG64_06700 [Acidobacteriota bacterium]PYY21052.1 MAG: hypothetical protein DMG62_20555 [Acidobacteriota bacterium]